MNATEYKRSLGILTKKEVKKIAPKDAQWADLGGEVFYKIVDDKVLMIDADVPWMPSSMIAEDFSTSYFHKLK